MATWESYKIDPHYLKQYQWVCLPSTLAVVFVALTKGNEDLGFWLTFILGWLIYSIAWFNIYDLTIKDKEPPNKKQYHYSLLIFQCIFISLCLAYVFII